MSRINSKTVNKRAIEALNASGALQDLEKNRAKVAKNAERLIEFAGRLAQDRSAGQADMFGSIAAGPQLVLADAPSWGLLESLDAELAAAGFYLSGHRWTSDHYAPRLNVIDGLRLPPACRRGRTRRRPGLPKPSPARTASEVGIASLRRFPTPPASSRP